MKCNFCEWECDLSETRFGFCKMYFQQGGEIKERFPNRWSCVSVSRIESTPFYHAYPGGRSMVIGTSGCNFRCRYCSNGFIACENPENIQGQMIDLTPEELVEASKKLGCHNIIFNVNEPAVSLPTLRKVGEIAEREGVSMGCLTNGYATEAATEILSSIFQFINIGLKGFSAEFYRKYIGVKKVEPILRNIRRLAQTRHLEITTPIIQAVNDHEIDEIAAFIADIDPEIPWHVFRLLPEHEMMESDYPEIDLINNALESARSRLSYVYFHNFVGSDWVNTICPSCGEEVIERFSLGCGGDKLHKYHCHGTNCPSCRKPMRILGGKVPWIPVEAA